MDVLLRQFNSTGMDWIGMGRITTARPSYVYVVKDQSIERGWQESM